MNQVQPKTDVLAIVLSITCILHCMLLPVLIASMPLMTTFFFFEESFHIWIIIAVVPISAIALYNGWKKHREWKVCLLGAVGIISFSGSTFLGHEILPEWIVHLFLSLGSALTTIAHIWNIYLRKHDAITKKNESFTI